MSNKWIRKGDKVLVISGNEKGQVGSVIDRKEDSVIIEGLNIRKKHVKPKQRMQPGIIERESPIHISNVALCDEQGSKIKVRPKINKDGSKTLFYMKDGKENTYREMKKKKD